VPHIIVCGHYDCGAVKAASSLKNHGAPLENWLTSIRDVKRMHHKELRELPDQDSQVRRLVELNVIESCLSLFKTGTVQRARVNSHADPASPFTTPRIHAMVYDPSDGKLERLKVDFKSLLDEFSDTYDIHGKNALEE
jgi:carbonic anhydrase